MRAERRQKRLIVGLAVSRKSVTQCRISQPQTRVDAVQDAGMMVQVSRIGCVGHKWA